MWQHNVYFIQVRSVDIGQQVNVDWKHTRMCLGGMWVLSPYSMERKHYLGTVLTILRHSNIKMVAYKLSKNGWVMPFFVIFRLAREKLLVTVALDHPVVTVAFLVTCPLK